MAFQARIAQLKFDESAAIKTANYTLIASDDTVIGDTTAGSFTLTLPSAVLFNGRAFAIKKSVAANTLTLAASGSDTIDGSASVSVVGTSGYMVVAASDGWHVIAAYDSKGSALSAGPRTVTAATVTVLAIDYWLKVDCTSNAVTCNLPAAALKTNQSIDITKIDGTFNTITVVPNGSETINLSSNLIIPSQYNSATLKSDGSNWWLV